ncbi:hypothetical protein D3C75_794010 [compost metagenome]
MNAQQLQIILFRSQFYRFLCRAVSNIEAELRISLASGGIRMVGMRLYSRSHAQQNIHHHFLAQGDGLQHAKLYQIVDHEAADPGINRHFDLIRRFVVAVKMDALSRKPGLQSGIQLTVGHNVQRKPFLVSQTAHGHYGEGFAGIGNLEAETRCGKSLHVLAAAAPDQLLVHYI